MTSHTHTEDLRSVDRELLSAMRFGRCMGIGELTEDLGVTATAVRQRIDRLLEKGLIEREKVVSGRGRPTYCYRLTHAGNQRAGADTADLVDALWNEVIAIEDSALREQILAAVAKRLGRQLAQEALECCTQDQPKLSSTVADCSADASGPEQDIELLQQRLKQLSQSMVSRKIPIEVSIEGELPVVDMGSCPFPTLTDLSRDRSMCRLEERMISEAVGQPMRLSSCRLDGDSCCQFSAIGIVDQTNPTSISAQPIQSAGN
ncbi:MAG: ArsR family transcriptional regulator [Planctomycetota bacterium]|nr:ArsR family transcriptional regulator [Planctomycetota bacterium]